MILERFDGDGWRRDTIRSHLYAHQKQHYFNALCNNTTYTKSPLHYSTL